MNLIFLSDAGHLPAGVGGGVQACTQEYMDVLRAAGFSVTVHAVRPTRRLWPRVEIKLGLEVYGRYDFTRDLKALCEAVDKAGARFVALNQMALIGFAPLLKARYGQQVHVVALSHGNESGDYLHEIVRRGPVPAWKKLRDVYRLGAYVFRESTALANDVDCLVSISQTDLHIGKWLGARADLYLPRLLNAVDIGWAPVAGRVGFVGSLNHKPNLDGIVAVARELQFRSEPAVRIRIVGGPEWVGRDLEKQFPFIDFVGNVSDDALRNEAASWSMFLNPVWWYSRGASTKLATGIGWGIPIVSTPAGNRGYRWAEGSLCTVNTPAEMADRIVSCSTDMSRLAGMASEVVRVRSSGPQMDELAAAVRLRLMPG